MKKETAKRVTETDNHCVGDCCDQLASALITDPYLDPDGFNLYVFRGVLYVRLYNDRHAHHDEPLNYCPWCGCSLSPSNGDAHGRNAYPCLLPAERRAPPPPAPPIALPEDGDSNR